MVKLLVFLSFIVTVYCAPRATIDENGRIVGGDTVNIDDYGWTLSLQTNNNHFCGAVLITNNIALTAAHCVVPGSYILSHLRVRAGSTSWGSGGQEIKLSRVTIHQNYRTTSHDFDIGVLFLASLVNHPSARLIALAPENFNPSAGVNTILTGWGTTRENSDIPNNLQMVEVPTVSHASCRAVYGNLLTSNMWCAGYTEGGKDSCQGDSGGPAVINNVLAGIVSFGVGCARPGIPGVYVSIPAFRSWISNVAGVEN